MKLASKVTKALLLLSILGFLLYTIPNFPVNATSDTIHIVKDIIPGLQSSNLTNFVRFKGSTFFIAEDGPNGINPWITDGTTSGTFKLKNISTFSEHLEIGDYKVIIATEQAIFFEANKQLWKTDGTEAGTNLVTSQTTSISGMQARGNDLFIFDGSSPARLHIYRNNNLELLKTWDDRSSDPMNYQIYNGGMTVLGDTVYFVLFRQAAATNELWKSDGTIPGTVLVASLPEELFGISVGPLVSANNLVFLRSAGHIYQSTGALGNLEEIEGTYYMDPYRGAFVSTGSAVFFVSGRINMDDQADLYMTTGKSGGIQKVAEYVYPNLVTIHGRLYFYSDNSLSRGLLGISDGTQEGTGLFHPISGNYRAVFSDVVEVGNRVYFIGRNMEGTAELWVSDGYRSGCRSLGSLRQAAPSTRAWLAQAGRYLVFTGVAGSSGVELLGLKVLEKDLFLPLLRR